MHFLVESASILAVMTEQQKQIFDIYGHLERLRSDQSLAKILHLILSTLSVLFSYMGLTLINFYIYALLTLFFFFNNVSSAVHKMV